MSKKRNQVLFTKPEDPKFLKLIKAQAGYKEDGPTVDSKRAKYEDLDDSDYSDGEEEQPQVVVVKRGDLTAAEAEEERLRIEKENSTKPADLSERIVFKSKSKSVKPPEPEDSEIVASVSEKPPKKKKTPKGGSSKLSFDFEDNDEEEE